jgi:hypothetical protein
MLRNSSLDLAFVALLAAGFWLLGTPMPAQAGCGCDHPPPGWAPVMPAFASPGKTIVVTAEGAGFKTGRSYEVSLKPTGGNRVSVDAVALDAERLKLSMPDGLSPGPTAITVSGQGSFSVTHSSSLFTALPEMPVVPVGGGALQEKKLVAAVDSNGTLLLPINVRHVQQGMQFAFQLEDLPYVFGPDDVVIYNADGVDLTLFTLAVDGQTEMQWGSYYGWEVEDDTGLYGLVYDTKVSGSSHPDKTSDVLTYWRHEFETYSEAHAAGGSHEPDASGAHPDGTLHVNHGHLIIAIDGMMRSRNDPDDPSSVHPLSPGKVMVDVNLLAVAAERPIEPDLMLQMIETETGFGPFEAPDSHFDEFEGMGD